RVLPVVTARARGGGGDDRVRDVAVVHGIVDAGDGDRLGNIPVGARKGQARLVDRALGGVARAQADRHVRDGSRYQHHGERGGATGFGRRQAARRRDGDAGKRQRRRAVRYDSGRVVAVNVLREDLVVIFGAVVQPDVGTSERWRDT